MARQRPAGEVWMLLKDRRLLGRLIALQGWSIRELSRESGFKSHTYLLRLISGQATSCTAERAVAIAAQLNVPLDTLFLTRLSTDPGRSVKRPFPGTADGNGPTPAGTPRRRPTRPSAAAVKKAS